MPGTCCCGLNPRNLHTPSHTSAIQYSRHQSKVGRRILMKRLAPTGLVFASLCAGMAWLALAPGATNAETCLSPFVKRLEKPEKHLYVFCVDADAKDND